MPIVHDFQARSLIRRAARDRRIDTVALEYRCRLELLGCWNYERLLYSEPKGGGCRWRLENGSGGRGWIGLNTLFADVLCSGSNLRRTIGFGDDLN